MSSWFNPSDPGYGTGWPSNWKGWLALLVFFGLIGLLTWQLHDRPYVLIPIILVITPIFVLIARAKTEGGWKWRNSRKEK